MVKNMKKIDIMELIAPPSVVFMLFYGFMLSKNFGSTLEISLFMALLTLAIKLKKIYRK